MIYEFLVTVVAPNDEALFEMSHCFAGTAFVENGVTTVYVCSEGPNVIEAGYRLVDDLQRRCGIVVTGFLNDECDMSSLQRRLTFDIEAHILASLDSGAVDIPLPNQWNEKGLPIWDWHDVRRYFAGVIDTPLVPSRADNRYLDWWIKHAKER